MGRKIERGYSPKNVAGIIAGGVKIELSVIPVGKEHHTFFRERGKVQWVPMVNRRKDGPLAYRSAAIGALLSRIEADLPNVPLRLYYQGRMLFDSKLPDPVSDFLGARYAGLAEKHKARLLTMLGIDPAHPNPVFVIELMLTYPPQEQQIMTLNLLRTYLSLPTDWETLLSPAG